MPDDLVTMNHAAVVLGINSGQLYRLLKRYPVEEQRLGNNRFMRLSDVRALVEQHPGRRGAQGKGASTPAAAGPFRTAVA